MGQKTVRFSDLSGSIITQDDALARIVIREHPELGDSPVEIEVLTDEARAIEQAALRVAVVDLYLPGEDEPHRMAMDAGSFDKLATDKAMSELLISARPARRSSRTGPARPARGDRGSYASAEQAGLPHGGGSLTRSSGSSASASTRSTSSWPDRDSARSAWPTASTSSATTWRSWPGSGASSLTSNSARDAARSGPSGSARSSSARSSHRRPSGRSGPDAARS